MCVCVRLWLGVSVGGSACTVWSECVCVCDRHTQDRETYKQAVSLDGSLRAQLGKAEQGIISERKNTNPKSSAAAKESVSCSFNIPQLKMC